MRAQNSVEKAFFDELVKHRLVFASAVPGVFGRGAGFEDVVDRFRQLVQRTAKGDGAEKIQFPPCIPKSLFEKSEYLESFPQLAGNVFSFTGTDEQHKELIARIHEKKPWHDLQTQTEVSLTPAACYPVYPTMTGTLPAAGQLFNVESWVFRHEPSPEPTRMQAFRIHEFVRAGGPDECLSWRDVWLQRGLDLLLGLGLAAHSDAASDPFFGRGGRMMKATQKEQKLKFEVLVPVCSDSDPTAVCSFNYHQDHFGKIFDIKTQDGELAHTACLGFGMERIAMALFRTHGFVAAEWPAKIREQLWP